MKIEILPMGKMQETGESLLQLIQNNSLPTLDIFVREVVQNSLDAAIPNNSTRSVSMYFGTGEFSSSDFTKFTPEIAKNICNSYPKMNKYLYVKDTNTVGLTGPIHEDEIVNYDYGNLLKLVYNISKKQEQDGSGGSWGLGKTVYFRLGIGITIYYSRILDENGKYSSRLAITLIENEKSSNTLIDKSIHSKYTGVAWWGDHYKNTKTSCPITDENEIYKLLKVFNIKPYVGTETGTTVIIPFLKEDELLNNAKGFFNINDQDLPWLSSIEEYLRISLQRWYSPRLNNNRYSNMNVGKSFLKAYINEEKLTKNSMNKLFGIILALYNEDDDYFSEFTSKPYFKDISLRKEFEGSTNAGKICFIKLNKRDLGMFPPENEFSPFLYCNTSEHSNENPPIICFTRKPGMIVNYDIGGQWSYQIGPFDQDTYVIALFKPNSDIKLKEPVFVRDRYVNDLESYLRGIEYGDHTSWQDVSGKRIISKIQNNIRKSINEEFEEKKDIKDMPTSNLVGRQLADLFLPKSGFGRHSHRINRKPANPITNTRISKAGLPNLSILSSQYSFDRLDLNLRCFCGKNKKSVILELEVDGESGAINSSSWENDINTPFPLEVSLFKVNKIENEYLRQICEGGVMEKEDNHLCVNDFEFELLKSSLGKTYAVRIVKPSISGCYIDCDISITFADKNIQGLTKIREDK